MDTSERHLRLLTETIAAVNSTLDLEEVLALVARKVAEALDTEACFVYLYDEAGDELVLRATYGTSAEAITRRPRHRRRGGGADHDPRPGPPRPPFQGVPESPRGPVRVDPRGADPRPREARRGPARPPPCPAGCHPRTERLLP